MRFINKVVLVTGASSGIGAAAAILFAKEGAKTAIIAQNKQKLKKVREDCEKIGGEKPLILTADITSDHAAISAVKSTIERYGKLDVLVNNAGISRLSNILDENHIKVYDEVLKTNLRAPIFLSHLAIPHLIKTKGNIVNISSVSGSVIVNSLNYLQNMVSKAGLSHFSRSAAVELAKYGIRVNTVSPGPVRTDIMINSGIDHSWDITLPMTLLNRVSEPEEIADIILYLASDKAKGVTGSNYYSDNGMKLK